MRIFGKGASVCLIAIMLLFIYSCADRESRRENAAAVARTSIARNADRIVSLIAAAVVQKTGPRISEGDIKLKARKSLDALHVSVLPVEENANAERPPGLWRFAFRSDLKTGNTGVTYSLLVSARLGLISSVESIVLNDVVVDGEILELKKKVK